MYNINKFYTPLLIVLCVFTFLLNLTNKIHECALMFSFICLITNSITSIYGKRTAMKSILICTAVSALLLSNVTYYIHGRAVGGVVIASLISVIISTYCSSSIFTALRKLSGFNVSNSISLIACALVDGFLMAPLFMHKYSANITLSIFTKEVLFKCLYSGIIFLCILVGAFLVQRIQGSNKSVI